MQVKTKTTVQPLDTVIYRLAVQTWAARNGNKKNIVPFERMARIELGFEAIISITIHDFSCIYASLSKVMCSQLEPDG